MTSFAQNPETQAEIEKLCPLLRNLSVGLVLSYDSASAVIGRDAQAEARYSLLQARARVEKEDGIRYATVRGEGIKRLSADEVPAIGVHAIRLIHKQAKKTVKRLSDLRGYNDMKPDERLRIAGQRMVASHIVERTASRAVREVEDSVRQAGSAIDFGTVLDRK